MADYVPTVDGGLIDDVTVVDQDGNPTYVFIETKGEI